jgi:hypothetical protein
MLDGRPEHFLEANIEIWRSERQSPTFSKDPRYKTRYIEEDCQIGCDETDRLVQKHDSN